LSTTLTARHRGGAGPTAADAAQLKRIAEGLRLVTVPFPYLAGLAAAVRVALDDRIPTMGVFASGRMLANPHFARKLKDNELVFVLAHELLHLALRTHDRAKGSDRLEFNYAHDYIINDILRNELGFQFIPANGLDMPGARDKSAEEIVLDMRRNANRMQSKTRVFDGESTTVGRMFGPGGQGGKPGKGGKAAGNAQRDKNAAGGEGQSHSRDDAGDVLDEAREKQMFPNEAAEQAAQAERIKEVAAKGLALGKAIGAMKGMRGADGGGQSQVVTALRGLYRTPWEMALQRWIESVAPGERTFIRPSRRGTERADIVLPGRRREGWILNVVLDTSGSMTEEIPRALGAIADFCDSVAIDQVRLVQCDATVTADEMLSPLELARWRVSGYGGSDLSPAMEHLAEDAHVRAVIVITDGDIVFPTEAPPYQVLWVLPPGASMSFRPQYGHVVVMQQG
jgi:predicted metal-dependent peptidase